LPGFPLAASRIDILAVRALGLIALTVTVAAGAVIGAVFDSPATGETEYAR
jgi:hypothetical protein